jgi:DNA-directed RNA polymerase specialized sigma24 family protein
MLTTMTTTPTTQQLVEGVASTDPGEGLRAVAALRRLLEQVEALQVDRARSQGWSWQEIAAVLGVTKQTVHRKHRGRGR